MKISRRRKWLSEKRRPNYMTVFNQQASIRLCGKQKLCQAVDGQWINDAEQHGRNQGEKNRDSQVVLHVQVSRKVQISDQKIDQFYADKWRNDTSQSIHE